MQPEEKTRRQVIAERIRTASERSVAIQVIMVLSSFAGLCTTLFFVLKSLLVSDTRAYLYTTVFTLVVLLVLLAFFFVDRWKAYLIRATIVLLLLFSLVLAGLVYWQRYQNVDPWVTWSDKVSTKVNDCEKLYQEQRSQKVNSPNFKGDNPVLSQEYDGKVTCVGKVLREPYPHKGQETTKRIFALNNDVRAGAVLMENPTVAEILQTRFGIGDRFLGTGFAVPYTSQTYGDARLVEYLVPNFSEENKTVLAWQIPPLPNLSQSVECLVAGCILGKQHVTPTLPSNIKSANEQKYTDILNYLHNPQYLADDKKPVLIRVNQFNSKDDKGVEVYSKKLGREETSSVFMIRLRDVWNVSLKDAITLSGHEGSGDTLFVWIYVPTADGVITPATWKNILPNMDKLLAKA